VTPLPRVPDAKVLRRAPGPPGTGSLSARLVLRHTFGMIRSHWHRIAFAAFVFFVPAASLHLVADLLHDEYADSGGWARYFLLSAFLLTVVALVSPAVAQDLSTKGGISGTIVDTTGGPFHTYLRPPSTIVTGDFNLEPEDPLHARMMAPFADGTPSFRDAWSVKHPGAPHPSTFKIYEKERPDEPELHCDFIFVSEDLVPRVSAVRVDRDTRAADHQPVILTLD